jgi:transposase
MTRSTADQPKRRPGRPSKLSTLDPKKLELAIDAVRAGNYLDVVPALVGINRDTLFDWLKRGARARPGSELREFSDRFTHALAESESGLVTTMTLAAQTDWRAAFALLERRFPDRWGPRQRIDVGKSGKGGDDAVIRVKLRLGGTE